MQSLAMIQVHHMSRADLQVEKILRVGFSSRRLKQVPYAEMSRGRWCHAITIQQMAALRCSVQANMKASELVEPWKTKLRTHIICQEEAYHVLFCVLKRFISLLPVEAAVWLIYALYCRATAD